MECEWCGMEVERDHGVWHGLHKFCSNKCLNEWAAANPKTAKTAKKKGCLMTILIVVGFIVYCIIKGNQ